MSEAQLAKGNLFDPELVKKVISKVKGHSSIAKLSPQSLFRLTAKKSSFSTLIRTSTSWLKMARRLMVV